MYKNAYTERFLRVFLLSIVSAFAQSAADTGQVSGVIKDLSGAVVPGSEVTLTNQQTKAKTSTVTDGQGAYKFPSVPPGAYVIDAFYPGFLRSVSPESKV